MSGDPREVTVGLDPLARVFASLDALARADAEVVDALREANEYGWTWRQLAEQTGVPMPTLHRWATRALPVGDEHTGGES